MSAPASQLLFGDEQLPLPGIPRCAHPALVPAVGARPDGHCPGQLALGPSQMLLADADPEPLQPSLLPEPAPWELVDRPIVLAPNLALVGALVGAPVRQLRLFPLRLPRLTALA